MSLPFQIDADIEVAQSIRPNDAPGVRMLAGKPYVYDAELKLSFEARKLVRSWIASGFPLSMASDDGLDMLHSAAMRRSFDTHGREASTQALFSAVAAERIARMGAAQAVAA